MLVIVSCYDYIISVILYSLRSFGCVLYELLTLNKLFDSASQYEVMRNIMEGPIPNIEESEPLFETILEKY